MTLLSKIKNLKRQKRKENMDAPTTSKTSPTTSNDYNLHPEVRRDYNDKFGIEGKRDITIDLSNHRDTVKILVYKGSYYTRCIFSNCNNDLLSFIGRHCQRNKKHEKVWGACAYIIIERDVWRMHM